MQLMLHLHLALLLLITDLLNQVLDLIHLLFRELLRFLFGRSRSVKCFLFDDDLLNINIILLNIGNLFKRLAAARASG